MLRARVNELEKYPFSVDLEVRVSDLNYGAHLGYDRMLGMAHEARLRLFDGIGATELNLGDGKTGIVVVDVVAVYLGEAFLGDTLTFEICPNEISRTFFRLAHRVTRRRQQGKVALVDIGFAAFDYRQRKTAPLPERFAQKLEDLRASAT
jgi:acyl-CoA thioesterase FadM